MNMARSRDVERQKMGSPERPSRRVKHQSEPADWSLASAELIVKLVVYVTACGGAVRFGYTSDGGAYAVGFYGDGDPYTEYIRPTEDIDEVLKTFIEGWTT